MNWFWIFLGICVAAGIGAMIFSDKSDPKERAAEAAMAAGGTFLAGIGCVLQFVLAAIPIAIAILIVIGVLKGCK